MTTITASASHVLERDVTFDMSFHALHKAETHVDQPTKHVASSIFIHVVEMSPTVTCEWENKALKVLTSFFSLYCHLREINGVSFALFRGWRRDNLRREVLVIALVSPQSTTM
ncbi:hypothetical protein D5086_010783 [Populus alba]|uniref:Uncharacterized protein n=1 Tax=Populus alba TaxID=43335 RepID=A0ACC4CBW1_POPAL